MAEFPSLPLFTDAFIADTTHLNAAETGAYMMLLMCAWRRPNCDLPMDDKTLAKFARCTPAQWKRIKNTVLSFWDVDDGFFKQKKLSNVKEKVSLNSQVAKRNAEARWLKNKESANANAGDPQCSPKPKPKPVKKDTPLIVPPEGEKRKRKCRIPDDFDWNDKRRQVAVKHHVLDPDLEFQLFYNHHSGRGTTMLDWDRAWLTWCLKSRQFAQPRGSPQKRGKVDDIMEARMERERRRNERMATD